MKKNYGFLTLGLIWTIIFAAMSFYWALGGTVGVRSLGGAIYEMSLDPTPDFIRMVWLTGVVKLLGISLLLGLLVNWKAKMMVKLLYWITKLAGIFLFAYGLLNFITISLSALGLLDFELEPFATFWRLVFWEPFWMIGGIFYFFAVRAERKVSE